METKNKLYRSRKDRIFFGVCGGISEYFGFDSAITRIIFLFLFLVNGLGFLLYILFLLIVPREPGIVMEVDRRKKLKDMVENIEGKAQDFAAEIKDGVFSKQEIIGLGLILLGAFFLAGKLFPAAFAWISWGVLLPIIVIIVGFIIIIKARKRKIKK